jgi:hypothetical protein
MRKRTANGREKERHREIQSKERTKKERRI